MDFSKIILEPKDVNYVIYHADCCDGFGAAYAAWKLLGNNATYYPAKHNTEPPDLTDKNVVICDFSYKYPVLKKILDQVNDLVILDHHISAQKDLAEIPEKNKVFRMDHSGAYITWKYFHRSIDVPKFILYIEDRDIWKKEMPFIDEFSSVFFSVPFVFEEYDKFLEEEKIQETINKGLIILEYSTKMIDSIIKHACCKFCKIGEKFYLVAYVNSNVMKSDIGNKLITKTYPLADFAIVYNYDDASNNTWFSLRSTNEKTNVSEIATKYGGGGHACASGITLGGYHNVIPSSVYDSNKVYELIKNVVTSKLTINKDIFNILYLNSASHKLKIGTYLLQQKYANYDMAAVWSFDGSVTWFSISFNDNITDNKKEAIINTLNGKLTNQSLIVRVQGLCDNLDQHVAASSI